MTGNWLSHSCRELGPVWSQASSSYKETTFLSLHLLTLFPSEFWLYSFQPLTNFSFCIKTHVGKWLEWKIGFKEVSIDALWVSDSTINHATMVKGRILYINLTVLCILILSLPCFLPKFPFPWSWSLGSHSW